MTIYDTYKRSGLCCFLIFCLFMIFSGTASTVFGCVVSSCCGLYWIVFLCRMAYYKNKDKEEQKKLYDKYIEQIKKDRARENRIEKEYGTIDYQKKHYK